MFDPESRYANVPDGVFVAADGREVAFKERRFLPRGETQATLAEVTVREGDRLDQIAATTLGAPEQDWRIADANNAMDPAELVEEPGRVLKIPVPGF